MEEAQPEEQLLEGSGLLTIVEEGWITDRVIQVALQQIGSQALQRHTGISSSDKSERPSWVVFRYMHS